MDLQDRVPAEKLIGARIRQLGDWRGEMGEKIKTTYRAR